MPFEIVRNDITRIKADAIVNTANPQPIIGAGTDTAIHQAAGPQLLKARKKIGDIACGEAAVTPAYGLNARIVIHAVGPAWQGGDKGEETLLRLTYENALRLAAENGCKSVAFPLMAAGSYGFPRALALQIAVQSIGNFLMEHEMDVWLVVFHKEAFQLSQQLMKDVRSYIDQHYVDEKNAQEYRGAASSRRSPGHVAFRDFPCSALEQCGTRMDSICAPHKVKARPKGAVLEDLLEQHTETFTEAMLRRIREQGWTEPEVYKRVYMDHKTFNKIRNNPQHQPSRRSALQLTVALHLPLAEAREFLGLAGYALSPSSKYDVVISYFLEQGNFDINDIDTALFEFTDKTLSNCG